MDQRVAPISRRVLCLCRFERIEHRVHAGIAGDVRDRLPPERVTGEDGGSHLLGRAGQEPGYCGSFTP